MVDCAPKWRAVALAGAGLTLTFAAPQHRLDLLAIGFALALCGIVWSPPAGLLLVGSALPFFFFSRALVGPLSVTPPGLAVILAAVAVVVRHRSLGLRWPTTAFVTPLALFLASALLSLLATEYPLLSVRELRAVIFEPVLFFWLLALLPGTAVWALGGFLAAASFTALAAILQAPLGLGGTQAEGVLRVQAWYPSANHLALMLGRAAPFLLAGALLWRHWLWIPVLCVGTGLALTFSTGGWLGALAGCLVVVVCSGRQALALRCAGGAALVLVVASGLSIAGALPERLNPLRQTGGIRLDLWLSSIEMLRDHPVLGIGLDNFAYQYQQVYLRETAASEPNLSHPHNWVLNFWLSLGMAGLVAFVWLLDRFWRRVRLALAASNHRWYVVGAAGALADMLVHGFIDNSYFLVDLAFLFWLSLALVDTSTILET